LSKNNKKHMGKLTEFMLILKIKLRKVVRGFWGGKIE
jgi:hypothetical protein